jgi:hypothetical protein
MQWYCRYTWYPGTTTARVRRRVIQQHQAGTNHPEKIRGWFNLAGGGAGFMLVEAEDPRQLSEILEPYMDLMAWDVHAIYELPYNAVTAHLFSEAHVPLPAEAGETSGSAPPFTSHSALMSPDGSPPLPPGEEEAIAEIFAKAERELSARRTQGQ